MKLQIKDSGSWRNVVSFDLERCDDVMHHAVFLLKALQEPRTVMRIADGDRVIAYCKAPDYEWMEVDCCTVRVISARN